MSLYNYVNDSPIGLIDPLGLKTIPGVPPGAVTYLAPDGQCFYAPPWVKWQAIYKAGQRAQPEPWNLSPYVGHNGKYDLQRMNGNVYPRYANAANYAVGVFMRGAGYSLGTTDLLGKTYGRLHSINFGHNHWLEWWKNGWNAANSKSLPTKPSKCKCGK